MKHFGEFKIAKLDKKEVSGQEYVLDELKSLRMSMKRMERAIYTKDKNEDLFINNSRNLNSTEICIRNINEKEMELALKQMLSRQ